MFLATLHSETAVRGKGQARDARRSGAPSEGTELEAGTPSSALGEIPGSAKPESGLPASGALSFNFSSHIPSPAPATTHSAPHAAGAGHCPAARPAPLPHVWQVSPYGADVSPGRHPHTFQTLPGRPPEPRSPAVSPAPPPHSPRVPRHYSAFLPAANRACAFPLPPSPGGARSRREGRWEAAGAGPGRS